MGQKLVVFYPILAVSNHYLDLESGNEFSNWVQLPVSSYNYKKDKTSIHRKRLSNVVNIYTSAMPYNTIW